MLGHSDSGVCALQAALLSDRTGRLARRLRTHPARPRRGSPGLLDAGERDALRGRFMHEIAGLPREQIALLRSLPHGKRATPPPTRFRARSGPTASTFSTPTASARSLCRRCCSAAATVQTPFKAATRALRAALSDARIADMPGQPHAAMDTGTNLFLAEVLSFLHPVAPRPSRPTPTPAD